MTKAAITGAARVAGIAGWPIAQSLSPVIHNAWLRAAGVDGGYVPFAVRDETGFEALVAAGRSGAVLGLNVTAPFKQRAFQLADEATARAKAVGSANILVFEDGRVSADSADGEGLIYALNDHAPGLVLKDQPVVLLGAGGAARAGAGSLIEAGARVRIVNRSQERAEQLAADLGPSVEVCAAEEALADAALVINALSVKPEVDLARLPETAVVMDMTYKPVRTEFLKAAEARRLTTVDGLGMLIGQAAPSFRALYRMEPPPLDLRALLTAHLEAAA